MAKSSKKLTPDVLGVLSRLEVTSSGAGGPGAFIGRITDGQLDRKVYVAFNEALEALGGTWNKNPKIRGHVFDHDPREDIDQLLLTGEFRTKFAGDFFQTPAPLAREMVTWAVRTGDLVLEPSAGHGRIVAEALKITGENRVICVEVDTDRALKLPAGCDVRACDFLGVNPFAVDSVVMNPPFSRGAEARHILHAMKFLRPGGRLCSVASAGVRFRQDAIYKELREALGLADIEDLPERTFAKEGTEVSTVLIRWTKP